MLSILSLRRGIASLPIVRYEELKRSLPAVVDEVARFLGIQLRGARRARVLERATFDFMKRHEDKFDFATEILLQSGHSGSGFLRGGRTGEWRDMLSAAQLEAFERCSRRRHRYPGLELDLPRFLH